MLHRQDRINKTPADDLAELIQEPKYWMSKAEALRASAGAVWYCQQLLREGEFLEELGQPKVNMSGTWQVYRMLCGMSLELAYKASLVAMGKRIKTTHDLVSLAEEVCFKLSSEERGLLALLLSVSFGKVVIPVRKTKWRWNTSSTFTMRTFSQRCIRVISLL